MYFLNETDQIIYFQELADLRKADMRSFRNISVDESNILMWQGLIVPVSIAVSVSEAKMRKNWITESSVDISKSKIILNY